MASHDRAGVVGDSPLISADRCACPLELARRRRLNHPDKLTKR